MKCRHQAVFCIEEKQNNFGNISVDISQESTYAQEKHSKVFIFEIKDLFSESLWLKLNMKLYVCETMCLNQNLISMLKHTLIL